MLFRISHVRQAKRIFFDRVRFLFVEDIINTLSDALLFIRINSFENTINAAVINLLYCG